MASFTYCILIVLAIAAYDKSFVEALCPTSQEAGEAEMKRCLASVGLGGMGAGAGAGDASQLQQYCSDGSLDRALNCVQGILDDCKRSQPSMGSTLNKVISVDQLRHGFKYMCDNLDILIDNADCIARGAEPMGVCVQAETQKFQAEFQAKMQSGQLKENDVWSMTCGFLDRVFGCQHTAYDEACGNKVAEVMTTFMQSMRPPICSDYSSATSIITNTWLMFSGLFFIILLHFRS